MTAPREVDVVVVGGGPAGAAAAIELSRAGVGVALVERRAFPRAKVCGGCVGPQALACLEHLGLDPATLPGAVPVDRVRVAASGSSATLALPHGLAIERATLDDRLLSLAARCGVHVSTATRAEIQEPVGARRRVCLSPGRDLLACVVVRATGLPPAPVGATDARVGLGQTAPTLAGPAVGEVWMATGAAGYVGMARFGDGQLNVAASVAAASLAASPPGHLVDAILMEAGLDPLGWQTGWSGTRPLRADGLVEVEERVLPVGDAAGFWEPFTGEGIGWALEAGIDAAAPVARLARRWDDTVAERWLQDRRAWTRRAQSRSRLVAALVSTPRLARLALGVARRVPAAGQLLIPRAAPARLRL
jgi:flavin-dependent dehydrogenase